MKFWKLDLANDEIPIVVAALKCHRDALIDSGEPDVDVDVDLLSGIISRIEFRIVPAKIAVRAAERTKS